MSDEAPADRPVFVVRVWDGGRGHWEENSAPEVVTLGPGEVFEFGDQFYSFAIDEVRGAEEIVHACPLSDGGLMPCCGLTPFEVPGWHRMTLDPELVTCGKPVVLPGGS